MRTEKHEVFQTRDFYLPAFQCISEERIDRTLEEFFSTRSFFKAAAMNAPVRLAYWLFAAAANSALKSCRRSARGSVGGT